MLGRDRCGAESGDDNKLAAWAAGLTLPCARNVIERYGFDVERNLTGHRVPDELPVLLP
jgi:hypothetical protein